MAHHSELLVWTIFTTEFCSLSDSFPKLALSLKRMILLELVLKSEAEVEREHMQLSFSEEPGLASDGAGSSGSRGWRNALC